MKLRALTIVLLLSLGTLLPGQAVLGASSLWRSLSNGIEYREFYQPEPNHLYVVRMDRLNPLVTLETSLAQSRLSGGLETVREQAERYDQAINYWGEEWGGRNQVVAAINGSFYDPDTAIPWSGMVHSGWYAKHFEERQNASGFAWTLGRKAFIGGCVVHPPAKQIITFQSTGATQTFDGINVPRAENQLVVYTPQFGLSTQTGEKGIEVQVELVRPMMIMPEPDRVTGIIKEIRDGTGSSMIPFDSVILSASGKVGETLRNNARLGEQVGISQEIRHLTPDCQSPNPTSWTKTYASVAAGFTFLAEGVIQGTDDLGAILRNPRTAIAFNDRYVFFIVVDGRDRLHSKGMSMVEMGVFTKKTLGATWGAALDGGGSSTLVVNGEVMNNPNAELIEQEVKDDALLLGDRGAKLGAQPEEFQIIERAVANGMMMVVTQPRELSSRFKSGDRVTISATSEVNVRLGPGTNYSAHQILTPGAQGVILEHSLNGVLAKGAFWWKIVSGEVVGWVSEEFLSG